MASASRLIAFLAALVLTIASGSTHARLLDGGSSVESARREIFAAVETVSSEFARATLDRVWKKSPLATTTASGPRIYAYSQVIEEYTSENGGAKRLAATFTFADDLIAQTRYTSTPTGGLMPTTRFVHADGFGSTRWLTDAAGTVTDSVEYDAFGETIARTGSTDVEHLYRSEQFDPSLGLYYLRARYADPATGRFLNTDPFSGYISDPRSLQRYVYAHSNPVDGRDPSGLLTLSELQTAMANVARLSARAAVQFGKGSIRGGFRFAKQSGEVAQKMTKRIVNECLKPKKIRENVPIRKGTKKQIDLIATLEGGFLNVEAKNRIPSVGSKGLKRLKDQLIENQKAGRKVIVVGGDKVSNDRLESVVKHFERAGLKNGDDFEIVNGFIDFSTWILEVYGEECLDL